MLGHDNAVYALDYSGGGGEILASAGADDTVRIWDHKDGLESVVTGIVPKIAPRRRLRRENARGERRVARKESVVSVRVQTVTGVSPNLIISFLL